ncbi:hypothetical protein GCM10009759_42450 [Kitasatospora saccharophila]|uniref:Golgi phosphoprotein 3 GPP34 n=1 Tax=Kitasatospora saccharophila TaxID=407973 RepID=A0ABP5IRR3_9ACTN
MTDATAVVTVESDLMTGPLVELWNVLLDLSERVPRAWSLIGGQMVLLHRYQRGEAPGLLVVDVLAPDKLGARANLTTTPPGRTLEVPGGRQAVQRTESVQVQLGVRLGTIHRPSLLGAIIAKAAALSIKTAPPDRHYRDLAFLLSLPMNPLQMRSRLEKPDRKKLALAKALHDPQHTAWRELRDDAAQADGHAAYAFLSPQ